MDSLNHPEGAFYAYVVDDVDCIVRLTSSMLRRSGCRVQSFTDPAQLLEAFRADPVKPDLLVSDYSMGAINGLDVIRECRRVHPGLKTILLSGSGIDEESNDDSVSQLVDRFIMKPSPGVEFIRIVHELLAPPAASPPPG